MHIDISSKDFSFSWQLEESLQGSLQLNEDPHCTYRQFLKICSGKEFQLIPEKYQKLTRNFVTSSGTPALLLPKNLLKERLLASQEELKQCLSTEEDRRYFQNWVKIQNFLQSMSPARVDLRSLQSISSKKLDTQASVLSTFSPGPDGHAEKVKYSSCNSVTGRLSVVSGPHILTVPKEVRSCLRSSFEGGSVLAVDFKSIEPRVALLFVGQQAPEDVYGDLLEEFPEIGRDAAKLATLVALYGGQVNRLTEVVGDIGKARKAVAFVKSHFRVDELERRLSQQADSGMVRNLLGRPLRDATKNPRIRTNHFLQSSAAELCALLFAELVETCPAGVRPLFVIHDALVADVRGDTVESFVEKSNSITWKGNKMPVKIEKLSPI